MRELHVWHGDRHRHAPDAAVDVHAKHAADSPRLRVLWDPEVRKAEFFKYQKTVQEYEAKHAAGQLKPQEEKPEHASLEIRDEPTSRIAKRHAPLSTKTKAGKAPALLGAACRRGAGYFQHRHVGHEHCCRSQRRTWKVGCGRGKRGRRRGGQHSLGK